MREDQIENLNSKIDEYLSTHPKVYLNDSNEKIFSEILKLVDENELKMPVF